MRTHLNSRRGAALLLVAAIAVLLPAGRSAAQASPDARPAAEASPAKRAVVRSIDQQAAELSALSDRIWSYAEVALREHRSAAALAEQAERNGFRVERGVAGLPTAFVARYGQGRPVIGILGEYDALPGLSQRAVPEPAPLVEGAAGHGCGHNLLGAASLGAAIAVKQQIESGALSGTVVYFGTPAEEDTGGKTYMLREGLFRDLDAVLAWHPADETEADRTTGQAMVDLAVEFRGRSAHAAYDPWNARSAVDALELFTHGVNLMREHVRPTSRMHYTITAGGAVPNVVPDYARAWLWLRDAKRAEVEDLLRRVRRLAEGAAAMTETTATVAVQGGSWEMLVNEPGARLLQANLLWLGPANYTEAEQAFARQLQRASGVPEAGLFAGVKPLEGQVEEGGSTDVADVSWVVPTLHLSVATAPLGVPWHSWPVVASSGMSIGHQGLLRAAKVLAATLVDLYEQPATLAAIRADFEARKGSTVYRPYLPEGPPPLPGD